ncbi:fumarylacetoacetate hydrolase domain containing protein [Pseudohyphozyma bogoriensis]|nr:fumarylacetoacetate hydrolase domain containing protein [Pseudohyphozyma bogoriensis]
MSIPTRTIRFIAKEDGKTYYGAPTQSGDLGLLYHSRQTPITAQLLSGSPLETSTTLLPTTLTVQKLLSPLSKREIGTIRGMGNSYQPNDPKITLPKPEGYRLFYKPGNTLSGPEDDIVIPKVALEMDNEYESYVYGYCVANDITSRGMRGHSLPGKVPPRAHGGEGQGKSCDTWCPLGPVLVSAEEIQDPQNLEVRTTVNGILKQSTNTSRMFHSVAELISMLSEGTTLEKGSIILTGSPPPLDGIRESATAWLVHGDVCHVEVEGLGTLINAVVEEGKE